MEIDLIKYCIRHMSSKELICRFYEEHGIECRPSDTYLKLSNRIVENNKLKVTLSQIRQHYRRNWQPTCKEIHIANLRSGLINGHGWFGARPSMLHLSMQDRVRECINGKFSLENLIEIGSNIMKHEYFMVATHDLCETTIIENFPNIIPSIGSKSISDFVFKNMPFDLKNTNYFSGHDKEFVNSNKEMVINRLLEGADTNRLRKQAEKTINNWGLNRFYVMVENQDRWLSNPEELLLEITLEVKKLKKPFEMNINGLIIHAYLIAV